MNPSDNLPKRKKSAWFAFYPDDYTGGTRTMSLAAKGAFVDLLSHQFAHGSIPSDDRTICRIIGAFPDEWEPIKNDVLSKFTDNEDGTMSNDRMEKERQEREGIREKRVIAALIGNEKRWGKDIANGSQTDRKCDRKSGVLRIASTSTSTSTSMTETNTTKPPKSPKGDERGFEEFWKAYPKKVGKEAARRAWNKSKPELDAVKATLDWQVRSEQWTKDGGQFVPNPATWINQGRWDDVRPGTSQPMPISTPRPDGPPHDYDDLLNDESVVPYEVKMAYGGRGARWRNLPEEIRKTIKAESDRRAEMARNGSRIDADASEAPSECDHSGEDVTAPLRAIREQLAI